MWNAYVLWCEALSISIQAEHLGIDNSELTVIAAVVL